MVNRINQWVLDGCDYATGLSIYDEFGDDLFLKRILKSGEKPFNIQKLNEALMEMRANQVSKQPAAPVIVAAKPVEPETADIPAKSETAEIPALLKVTQERDANWAELRALHPYLHTLPDGEELRLVAKRIVQLSKKGAVLWDRYNYIIQHGDSPEPVTVKMPAMMVDINLINECENVRKALSKARKRAAEQSPSKPNTLALIALKEAEFKRLSDQIAELKAGGAK